MLITAGPVLELHGVRDFFQQLKVGLSEAEPLTVDLSQVERADTGSLQLLLALVRAAAQTGQVLTFGAPSPALRAAAHKLGLSELLEALPAE